MPGPVSSILAAREKRRQAGMLPRQRIYRAITGKENTAPGEAVVLSDSDAGDGDEYDLTSSSWITRLAVLAFLGLLLLLRLFEKWLRRFTVPSLEQIMRRPWVRGTLKELDHDIDATEEADATTDADGRSRALPGHSTI